MRTWKEVALAVGTLALLVVFGSSAAGASSVLVASESNDRVLRYDGSTGAFQSTFVAAGSGGLETPHFMAFGPDGNLYVTSSASGQVLRYDGTTGAFIDVFVPLGSGGLTSPQGLAFGRDGKLYVADTFVGVVRYNAATGAFVDVFVTLGSGGLTLPVGLVFGPDGNLYVASFGNDRVLRYNGTTGAFIETFVPVGSGGLAQPVDLVFGPPAIGGLVDQVVGLGTADLYVTSEGTNEVLRYNGTTGAFIGAFVAAGSGGLDLPAGLAFGPDRNLYVSSQNNNSVLRYHGTTGAFIDAFVPAGSGGLDTPVGLLFTPAPVPTLSQWAQILMVALLVATALSVLARRRQGGRRIGA